MRYIDLIDQTFHFPTEVFKVEENELTFNDVPLMALAEKYGTPLKISYLPKISQQIQKAQQLFANALLKNKYEGTYTYCYCTKSSHFKFILDEVLKNNVQLETSSAYDLAIVRKLYENGEITKDHYILSNGFKKPTYTQNIVNLLNDGFHNLIPILDNMNELSAYDSVEGSFQIGLRVATDEKPEFSFYTSRLGIRYNDINDFYKDKIKDHPKAKLKMLHFFINSGVKDTAYYWSELNRFIYKYCELKKICPELDTIDIGGGLPIQTSLHFDYNFEHMINEIVKIIKYVCDKNFVPVPHLFTEFGSFTVGESGAIIFSVQDQKLQNERELWYMIDGSFITHLPDTWGTGQKFIMLPINHWDSECHKVNLGGMTCDSDDYYNTEAYTINIYLPKIEEKEKKQYVGFFHTGAYQDSLGGYGGLQHCLIPMARHVIVNRNESGEFTSFEFNHEQTSEEMLKILGF
ncbi:MAG: arginine decarboxylase [Bacteroidetes bacterium]|nr:MAG: arginine decarboxylase [Bacteroidota bacterium]